MLPKKNYTAYVLQNVVHWALGSWMNPRGFHKCVIPLLVSVVQAGSSSDCDWQCEGIVPKWCPAQELTWEHSMIDFDALHLCQVNTGTPTRCSLAHLTSVCNMSSTGDDWCFLTCEQSTLFLFLLPFSPLQYVSPSIASSSSPTFSTPLWIIELFLSRGPALLIRCVGHQACFTAPSPVAAAALVLPRGIEEITHMPLTYFSLYHLLPLHLFSSSHPPYPPNLFLK